MRRRARMIIPGTTTLVAALDVTGPGAMLQAPPPPGVRPVPGQDRPRDTPAPLEVHLITDNDAPHKHAAVRRWLERHPRFHIHFTPTSASWLNMVERLFADLTCRRLRRGCFRSVAKLKSAIRRYLNDRNAAPKPFVWTKGADTIIRKYERAKRNLISRAGH